MTSIFEYAWLIPVFPLAAFFIIGFLGKKMKDKGGLVAAVGVGAAMVLSLMVAYEALIGNLPFHTGLPEGMNPYYYLSESQWVNLGGGYTVDFGIYIDSITALMLIVVSFVACLVVIYSIGYMHAEGERRRRYFTEITLFVGVMLGLVLASNFLQLFVFWELVGVCSYLLIGFWFEKPSAASAAKKAFLVTRIGDVMFMIGLMILFTTFGTLSFEQLFAQSYEPMTANQTNMMAWGVFFLFGGAVGKSAQFPLHDWLPDAMEGPTTVSALIHAATMVKAGVYLVARSFPLLINAPNVLLLIAIIGGVTAFMAATMALNNPNIKRVLAYSTISQLGYMFLALGAGGYMFAMGLKAEGSAGFSAGMFQLMNHAFFKALLFLSAGAVIHFVHTEEIKKMGGLSKKMKITSLVMLIGALSIAGIPPLSGFWSKDEVLASVYNAGEVNAIFTVLWVLAVATAFMTAFYMFRMWFLVFKGPEGEATKNAGHHEEHGQSHGDHDHGDHHHDHSKKEREAPLVMLVPLIILSILAFGSGFCVFIGNGFSGTIFFEEAEPFNLGAVLGSVLTYISIIVAVCGILLAYFTFYKHKVDAGKLVSGPTAKKMYNLLLARYGFTKGYNWVGERVVYGFSLALDVFDRKVIDGIVNAIARGIYGAGKGLRRAQTGFVQTYSALVVAGVAVLIILLYVAGALR
jgi:NADH-quinone oxidoreductase subunit L